MDLLANFGERNESAHNHGNLHTESSSSSDRQHPPARPHSSTRSPPHAGFPLRLRSRSPLAMNRTAPTKLPRSQVLGFGLDQLEFIRLTPHRNPQRQFEIRRFNFPADETIEVLGGPSEYRPVPTQEQLVLSTSDGEVFAILDSTNTLAGIYTSNRGIYARKRAKINMNGGKITLLTSEEIKETPVGFRRPLSNSYRVEHLHHIHGSLLSATLSIGSTSSSSRHIPLPTRLPSSDGFGYELNQLQFIRLIPMRNPSLIFELRRYTFPEDKSILFLEESHHYAPVPIQDLIVLTTTSGDVFAILESINHLAGIYTYNSHTGNKGRVRMNRQSGMVNQLTKHEMAQVPVGRLRPILYNFRIEHANQ